VFYGPDRETSLSLTHRSRNLLTIVLAIVRKVSTEEEYDSLSPRIRALAVTHDVLIDRNWQGGYLPDIVKAQYENFGYPIQVPTKAPNVLLNPTAMQMFGLAIHELASNNIRHNGGSHPRLHWRVANDRLKVMWYERLVNPDRAGAAKFGFGHYVLNTIMPQHFGGSSRFITTRNARAWILDVPLQKVDKGPQEEDGLGFAA
jgi:two-component sensor histidine kinase